MIKKFENFNLSENMDVEMAQGQQEFMEIKNQGSYFGHVTKDGDNKYYTHGQLGEGNEYNCEELFKYLYDFGVFSPEFDIFW